MNSHIHLPGTRSSSAEEKHEATAGFSIETEQLAALSAAMPHEIESLDGFQNLDKDWQQDDPVFEWTQEDLEEFERETQMRDCELQALAGWWEMEGVRCATFGRNPNENPYLTTNKT